MKLMSSKSARPRTMPAAATGAHAIGTAALGSLAIGAVAVGALAIGALSIGRLFVGRVRIRRLEIDELVVRRVRVTEQLMTPSDPGGVIDETKSAAVTPFIEGAAASKQ
ncbi:hypothetical protein QTI24_27070 [Variovorax sp. J22P240]|uniref:hypothetical protein n=1 Tax=Variovorax sp. J22P240 TaxID=3053514 RepID=UPI00257676F9|nr:hypothetical protein [Variovorax sp. J22P240]MDM0002294.1 hypothetical protein [Variovorax sp. J22P240]